MDANTNSDTNVKKCKIVIQNTTFQDARLHPVRVRGADGVRLPALPARDDGRGGGGGGRCHHEPEEAEGRDAAGSQSRVGVF